LISIKIRLRKKWQKIDEKLSRLGYPGTRGSPFVRAAAGVEKEIQLFVATWMLECQKIAHGSLDAGTVGMTDRLRTTHYIQEKVNTTSLGKIKWPR